jgi:hypothetical protein
MGPGAGDPHCDLRGPAMSAKQETRRQSDRQSLRERDGRYAEMNRCEVCDKPAGDKSQEYYSHALCNTLGVGVVLCRKHANATQDATTEAQFWIFAKVGAK